MYKKSSSELIGFVTSKTYLDKNLLFVQNRYQTIIVLRTSRKMRQTVARSEADITKAIDKRYQDDQSRLGRHGRWEMEISFQKHTRNPADAVDRVYPEQNKDCQSWVFIGMAQVTNRKRQHSTVRHKMKLPKKTTA